LHSTSTSSRVEYFINFVFRGTVDDIGRRRRRSLLVSGGRRMIW
jgi:hypothetical protein